MAELNKRIFITGGTGYIGSRLIPLLAKKGFEITALTRKNSKKKLPGGCIPVIGSALDSSSFSEHVKGCDTFIQFVGTPHPGPGKGSEFRNTDLVSVTESVKAASNANVKHFIYLSVAEPAPVMKDYIAVRKEGERLIKESKMNATFIKPWYVLGPGHRWPVFILPVYWLFGLIPGTRETARRLYPVKLENVLNAIVNSVENPANGIRKLSTQELKKF
jgi:uncharacterized protein YbjT (DUF2867 family)